MEKKRVMIVDDTPANLQLLGNILNEKYALTFATGGLEALELLKKSPTDLILLDIMMPRIDGFEVCRKVRSDVKMTNIPIIFLTAKTDRESVLKGMALGAQDYIIKPFSPEDVIQRIYQQLSRNEDLVVRPLQRSYDTTERVFLKNREDNILLCHEELINASALEVAGIEGRMAPLIKELPRILDYIRDLEELFCTDLAQKNKELLEAIQAIQGRRMDPELNSTILTMGESFYDIQFALLDLVSHCSRREEKKDIRKNLFSLRSCADRLEPLMPPTVVLDWEISGDRQPEGDEDALLQILIALIDNALDYGIASPEPDCRVIFEAPEGRVRITVTDQGPGMNETQLEKACLPGISTKEGRKGFGLTAVDLLMKERLPGGLLPSEEGGGMKILL